MSDKDKKMVKTIAETVTKMSDVNKGYILGMGEAMVTERKQKEKSEQKEEATTEWGEGEGMSESG